jgi:hypothetical protein
MRAALRADIPSASYKGSSAVGRRQYAPSIGEQPPCHPRLVTKDGLRLAVLGRPGRTPRHTAPPGAGRAPTARGIKQHEPATRASRANGFTALG